MEHKYKTDYKRLVALSQYLVNNKSFVAQLNTVVKAQIKTYGITNIICSDRRIAQAIGKVGGQIHIDVLEFYSSVKNVNKEGLGAFMELHDNDTAYYGAEKLRLMSNKTTQANTLYVINPPFDGTLHLQVFNECKEFADHIVCIHPSTQLQAINYHDDPDFNKYLKDGLEEQHIVSFTSFGNTRAFGDLVIDVWNKGCSGKTRRYDYWQYADRCTDKGLYPIIYDAVQRYTNKLNGSLDCNVANFSEKFSPGAWNIVVSTITTPCGNLLIRKNNEEPYDAQGYILNGKGVWDMYGHGADKGAMKWKGTKPPFKAIGFSTRDKALDFVKTWTTPEANVVINCMCHDQHVKHNLLPNILSGDICSKLGLEQHRQRMIEEYKHFKSNVSRYIKPVQGEVDEYAD